MEGVPVLDCGLKVVVDLELPLRYIYIYIYKVKLATIVKGDLKATTIATTPRCRGG